jgi:hypothetical protein
LNFKLVINRRKQKKQKQSNGMTIKEKRLSPIRAPVYSMNKKKKIIQVWGDFQNLSSSTSSSSPVVLLVLLATICSHF